MKVKIVSTYPPRKCGMAEHTNYLVKALRKAGIEPEIVEIKNPDSANPFYFIKLAKRFWSFSSLGAMTISQYALPSLFL